MECLAYDLGYLMRAIIASGHFTCVDEGAIVQAFAEVVEER
jgi:hypothetical protein